MKKLMVSGILTVLVAFSASAKSKYYYQVVSGSEALQDHSLNQYDDVENPPQGFLVKLPKGSTLISSNVEAEAAVCGVTSFDVTKQELTIEGLYIETDSGSCTVKLEIYNEKSKKNIEVKYQLEQVGT